MRKFFGLMMQEYRHYALSNYVMAGLVAIFVFLGPILIVQFLPDYTNYNVFDTRFTLSLLSAVFIVMSSIAIFTSSLNHAIKSKELWLHNSQSIYALIGVKIIYHGINMIVLCFIAFLGLFFVGDLIEGTFLQYLVFGFAGLIIVSMIYIFFIVFVLFLIALNKQFARYIGKLSYFVMFIAVILLVELLDRLPEFTLLKIGRVELSNMNHLLPKFADFKMTTSLYADFYIIEEVVVSGIFILLYVLICKWIERVITR